MLLEVNSEINIMRRETTDNINMFIEIQEYVFSFNLKGTCLKRRIGMINNCVMMHHLFSDKETQEYIS